MSINTTSEVMGANISINTTTVMSAKESPVFMNTFLTCGNIFCALFGIPLNLAIILLIIVGRRLRRQPRNIILIGISFSNIFVLSFGFYSIEATELCFFY